MTPQIGLITPVKIALGQWLTDFHAQFQPDTRANAEWAARATPRAIAWAPARMVDAVDEMLSSWKANDNSGKAGTSAFLPAMFVAVASDYTETPGEAGRPLIDKLPFEFPNDPLKRSFRLRILSADLRAQVAVIASDPLTAMSIVGQLCMWGIERRVLHATYSFAGFDSQWPVQVLGADRMAIPTPQGEQMTILTVDLTLRAGMPMFYAPAGTEATDGNGSGSIANPSGYPKLTQVSTPRHAPDIAPPAGVSAAEWQAFIRLAGGTPSNVNSNPGVVLHGLVDPIKE